MAFSVRQDILRMPAGTGVQSIGGLGFQPKALFLWSVGSAEAVGAFVQPAAFSLGFGTSSEQNWAVGFAVKDGVTTTDAARTWGQRCLSILDPPAANDQARCTIATLWSDGFNLDWTTVITSAAVNYLALGGSDLTNAKAGVFSLSNLTGVRSIGGVGFQPDVVFLMTCARSSSQIGAKTSTAKFSFGVAQSTTKRWAFAINARDGQTMTAAVDAMRVQRADSILVGLTDAAAADFQVDLSGMWSDGFNINTIDAPAGTYQAAYLALQGGQYDVGVFAKSTGAAPVSQAVTTGFSAAGVLLATFQIASTTAITDDTTVDVGAGDFTRASNAWQGVADAALSSAARFQGINPVLTCASRAIGTVIFEGSLTGRTSTDFNITWTTNDGIAAQVGYVAFGDVAVGGAQSSVFVTDGMYMNDFTYRGIDRVLTDRMFLADAPIRAEEHQQLDKVLLSDAAFAQAIRQVFIPDAVYLNDARFTTVDRNILEGILLADTVVRVLEKLVQDDVILYDRVTGVPLTVAAIDGLYLLDTVTRVTEHVQRDSLFLRDAAFRETLRTLLDRLLVADVRASNILELSFQDKLLLNDLMTKIQEMLVRDGLLTLDASATALERFIVDILVWARLRAENALGLTIGRGDPFGVHLGAGTDLLGVVIGAHKKPDVH